MANEQYQRAKAIYYQVCEMDPSERTAFLDNACSGDEVLRRDIDALLRVDDNGQFLQQPALDDGQLLHRAVASLTSDLGSCQLPVAFGRYRVLRLISEGGMGSVYEAEQDSPHRIVALKVIRSAFPSRQMVQRFEREIQILGRLHHSNIAQIYDADVAELPGLDGATTRPAYYTMEFINGLPLIEHANQEALNDRQRLQLLAKICDAVHFGHTHGVVHRDLKPSNIMVEASGEPKIIDFGVARATNLDQMATALNTRSGALIGTLAYMCPEQVAGDSGFGGEREGGLLDGRGDVYALGVIGFELLGGRLPYDLAGRSIPETARIIRDEEPTSLSSISRAYRGDVETIVRKAMAKEPAHRYQTAAELAADIRRFLNDEPILARPPTLRYQLGKFTRRHKELVAGLALVIVTLIAGIAGVSLALAYSLTQERAATQAGNKALLAAELATREASRAQRLSVGMQKMLSFARPGEPDSGRTMTVEELLDLSSQAALSELIDSPDLEIAMRRTLGQTYARLGSGNKALQHFQKAITLAEETYGPDSMETFDVVSEVGISRAFGQLSQIAQWAKKSQDMLSIARQQLSPTHPTVQRLLLSSARLEINLWRPWAGESLLRELLDILASMPPAQRAISLTDVRAELIFPLLAQFKFEEAEPIARQVLRDVETDAGSAENFEHRLSALSNLAFLAQMLQRFDAAAAYSLEVVEETRTALGDDNKRTAPCVDGYAALLTQQRRFDEALGWREVQRHILDNVGTDVDYYAYLLSYEGFLLDQLDRPAEARWRTSEAISRRRTSHGDESLAQEWWRGGAETEGGLFRSWASDAVRRHVLWHVERSLRARPTCEFDMQEIRWSELSFVLEQWDGSKRALLATGDLDTLRSLVSPSPGLYWLGIQVPRQGHEQLNAGGWLLMSNWQLDLFREFRQLLPELWNSPKSAGEHEARDVNALVLEANAVYSFGPLGTSLSFAVNATTSIALPAGRYDITIESDDGSRVWLDDEEIIDAWSVADQNGRVVTHRQELDGLSHQLRVRYFQHGQHAMLRLHAQPVEDLTPIPLDRER